MDAMLKKLRLPRIREVYDQRIDQAAEEDWGYRKFLEHLLQEEVTNRHQNRLQRRKDKAGFPFEKTLNQFEFNFRPKLKKRVFQTYTEPGFVTEGKDLMLIGPPGTGKTHLSVGIGLAQIKNDFKVKFKNVQSLAGELQGAVRRDEKDELLKSLLKVDLLITGRVRLPPVKRGVRTVSVRTDCWTLRGEVNGHYIKQEPKRVGQDATRQFTRSSVDR